MNGENWTAQTYPTYKKVDYTKQALAVLKIVHKSSALKYKTLNNFIEILEQGADAIEKL